MSAQTDVLFERPDIEKAYIAEKYVAYVRAAVILLNVFVYYVVFDRTNAIDWLANAIVGVSLVYMLVVIAFQPSRRFPVLLASYFTSITDAALIALWLYATGGVESPYYVLWYASIAAIAFRYDLRETLIACGIYSISYLGLLMSLGEVVSHPAEVILRIGYIFFVGIMGGLLARETARQLRSKFELRGLAQLLEHKVKERTRELEASEARAREASRVKSEFLATMSHELRTPLNAMIGFSEIMMAGMGGTLDDDARHMTTRIHANSQRLLELINDILDLSKIEARRVELNAVPFSPRKLVDGLETEIESLAVKKGLIFKVEIDPQLPDRLMGDESLIAKVVINLLSNAVKFTEKGYVSLHLDAGADRKWTITVRDTGTGIPPHALEYIFDPFRQIDGSSQRAYGGTGLGLAIVRELVRTMDGTVRVESAVGKGSTFVVSLPLQPATAAQPEAA